MCDPVSASIVVGSIAASTGGALVAKHAQEKAAKKTEKETKKKLEAVAQKQDKLTQQSRKDLQPALNEYSQTSDADTIAARQQAEQTALAQAPGAPVQMTLPGNVDGTVLGDLDTQVQDASDRSASQAMATQAMSAFGDRMARGARTAALSGSKIASNNAASQFLENQPLNVKVRSGASPLGDILQGVGQAGQMYGFLGAPGAAGAAAVPATAAAARRPVVPQAARAGF